MSWLWLPKYPPTKFLFLSITDFDWANSGLGVWGPSTNVICVGFEIHNLVRILKSKSKKSHLTDLEGMSSHIWWLFHNLCALWAKFLSADWMLWSQGKTISLFTVIVYAITKRPARLFFAIFWEILVVDAPDPYKHINVNLGYNQFFRKNTFTCTMHSLSYLISHNTNRINNGLINNCLHN